MFEVFRYMLLQSKIRKVERQSIRLSNKRSRLKQRQLKVKALYDALRAKVAASHNIIVRPDKITTK